MHFRSLIVTCLVVAYPVVAAGQATSAPGSAGAKGWFLGAALNGSSISGDDLNDERESGGGLVLHAGFGFTPQLALFLEGTAAAMQSDGEGSWMLSHGDLGLRYHFTTGGSFLPFVEGAFTIWSGLDDDADFGGEPGELEISGQGFTLGGGFLYFFTRRIGLLGNVKFTKGEFNKVRFENVSVEGFDIDATSARLNVGVTWFLGGSR
jgi:hypothetical protein